MATLFRRPLPIALLIGIAAWLLFLVGVATPSTLVFDETHYVPAARTILALERPVNTEHPLLGKALIALGMLVFGDNSFGWRVMATLGGAATVLGVFAILWLGFRRVRTAAFGAVLAALNFTLFIQARIGMLEVFLGAFVTLGIAALLWAMRAPPGRVTARWVLGAALLGLATAVKWTAAPYVAFAGIAFLVLRHRHPERWPGLPRWAALALLGAVSVGCYFLTFAPAFFYANDPLTLVRLLPFQWDMYEAQTQVLQPHPYQSNWVTWPLMMRPIWYLYEVTDGAQRGILLIGNPAVMWGGVVAVAMLASDAIKGNMKAGAIALLWVGSLAIWAVIPKSLGFYYYYHLSGIFVCVALAAAFDIHGRGTHTGWALAFVALALALFAYFYPILAALPLPDGQAFNLWMWRDSWR